MALSGNPACKLQPQTGIFDIKLFKFAKLFPLLQGGGEGENSRLHSDMHLVENREEEEKTHMRERGPLYFSNTQSF